MNEQVTLLATAYAESLVKYHETRQFTANSTLREDVLAMNRARDAMYDAQNALNAAAEACASELTGVSL